MKPAERVEGPHDYDPQADRPVRVEITAATVNDVVVARQWPIEPGTTLVFDKAYADYAWWHRLHNAGCRFVTRPTTNLPFNTVKPRTLGPAESAAGILCHADVRLTSQKKAVLPIKLRRIEVRRIEVQRDDGRILVIVSNDPKRSALDIAGPFDRIPIERIPIERIDKPPGRTSLKTQTDQLQMQMAYV